MPPGAPPRKRRGVALPSSHRETASGSVSVREYRAAWVLPIARPPIPHGSVTVGEDRILAVTGEAQGSTSASHVVDLGDRAILPGLVNAHTHLELSWMRGKVLAGDSMPQWAARLVALRATLKADPTPPIVDAIDEARTAGTALVGDVTNTLAACGPLGTSGVAGMVFLEVLGFAAEEPERLVADAQAAIAACPLRASIVPHAPYSVSPALFRAIAAAAGDRPLSVHLGESPDELQFLREGTGAWRELLTRLGVWRDTWEPPGCSPVEYLDRLGLLTDRLLAVHATQLDRRELQRLAAAGATVVACPRSNAWTGAGIPPVEAFYESGVRVAIGTDSLASVEDLNVFSELAALRQLAPGVPAAHLLQSATVHGASALGFGQELGTIEPGKQARLLAVRIPPSVDDVEEYLVSGIEPDAIEWLDR